MARQVHLHPAWPDKAFSKDYKKLSQAEQHSFQSRLTELTNSLRDCTHPITDPAVRKWRPSTYHIAGQIEGHLVEYRFPGTTRVIACYFELATGQIADTILLVAATLKHDHCRLKKLIEGQRSGLRWPTEQG